jgi:hypothetical protein
MGDDLHSDDLVFDVDEVEAILLQVSIHLLAQLSHKRVY